MFIVSTDEAPNVRYIDEWWTFDDQNDAIAKAAERAGLAGYTYYVHEVIVSPVYKATATIQVAGEMLDGSSAQV